MQTGRTSRSVRQRLTFGFGGLAVACTVVSGWSIYALAEAEERFVSYVHDIGERAETVNHLVLAMEGRAIAARNLLLANSDELRRRAQEQAGMEHAVAQQHLSHLGDLLAKDAGLPAEVRQAINELRAIEKLYTPVALAVVDLAVRGEREAAIAKLNTECVPLLMRLEKAVEHYSSVANQAAEASVAVADATYERQRGILIVLALAALAAAGVLGGIVSKRLAQSLGAEPDQLSAAVSRVADGDLSPIPGAEGAPADSVLASISRMQQNLWRLIGQVRASADSIATASSQIASGNHDLSGRTEQQAAALQQTSAQMHQMTDTVRGSAGSARQAAQLATQASTVAGQGGEMVGRVVQTMHEISESSRKIADIIGVIDGIAFQTNILALNAAVEAARAGEQGRGFAVVAGEVRSLASRSAEAAREIKSLIGTSVDRVEMGSRLVTEAGTTMEDIVRQVLKVNDLIAEIDTATGEQTSGIEQVNQAVASLDQGTQQNAALVEQSAAAAESLRQQAAEMTRLVAAFRMAGAH